MRDLPNMGEKERGKPDNPAFVNFVNPPPVSVSPSTSSFASVTSSHSGTSAIMLTSYTSIDDPSEEVETRPLTQPQSNSVAKPDDPNRAAAPPAPGWAATWRHFIYEKWRLCAFIALAVMLSRFTTRT